MKARISIDCADFIREAFARNWENFEIGGILLGIRADEEIIATKAVSIASIRECSYSYSLDGAKASNIVNSSEYDFVGIWHSHINSCKHFSETDKQINQELAELFDGIISILVSEDKDGVSISAFLVTADGKCVQCLL